MAHHASASPPPRTRRPRRLVPAVCAVLALLAVVLVWRTGGFAAAGEEPPQDPDSTFTNDLFSVTFTGGEATLVTQEADTDDPQYVLAVRAELTSHETSPQAGSLVLGFIEAELRPGGAATEPSRIGAQRGPDTYTRYPWVQPGTPEAVRLLWDVDSEAARQQVEQAERVRLRVLEARYEEDFLDQTMQWQNTDGAGVGTVVLPVDHVVEDEE